MCCSTTPGRGVNDPWLRRLRRTSKCDRFANGGLMATPVPALEPFHVMPPAADGRPRLVLRVGISGHRNLARADLGVLDDVLCQILKTIADTVLTIHADT